MVHFRVREGICYWKLCRYDDTKSSGSNSNPTTLNLNVRRDMSTTGGTYYPTFYIMVYTILNETIFLNLGRRQHKQAAAPTQKKKTGVQ